MQRPADHPEIPPRRIGVILVNLGTPDAPTPAAVRGYLKQFLSDRRVVEISPLIWQPILRGIILNTRPKKSAANYAKVWTDRGSPLAVVTADQADALQKHFGDAVYFSAAMRYGNPSIASELEKAKAAGCDRILIAPLYPQYSGATTATVFDEVARVMADMRWQPALRLLPPYYDDPVHIDALAKSVGEALERLPFVPDAIVASFHGMPERTLHLGDPYHCQCQKTARLLSDALGQPLTISFQSRLGRAKWLEPSTEATLATLAQKGVRKLAVLTPGFSADNLETLEEIAIRGRETFLAAGGTHFAALPCLNDGEPGMAMIEALVRRELGGWVS